MRGLFIEDERERENRYAAYLQGKRVGQVRALLLGDTVLLPHVEVDPGGHDLGAGSLLVRRVYDDARVEGTPSSHCVRRPPLGPTEPGYHGGVARAPVTGELAAVALVAADRTMRLLHAGRPLSSSRPQACLSGDPERQPTAPPSRPPGRTDESVRFL